MNPEIQKKIDRIAELVRQRDAIDRELEAILGVEPVKSAPSTVTTSYTHEQQPARTERKCGSCGQPGHTWRTCKQEKEQREKFFEETKQEDDEQDDDADDDEAPLPSTPLVEPIRQRPKLNYDKEALEADIRAGVLSPSTIAGKHGVGIATVYVIKSAMKKEGRLDRPARDQEEDKVADLSADVIEQIQDLRDRDMTTTEIANMLALDFDAVARVPARGSKSDRSIHTEDEDDELPEELEPEEESEDEDDDYDLLAYRGKVAWGEV